MSKDFAKGTSHEIGVYRGTLPVVTNRLHPSPPHMPVEQADCPACPANRWPNVGCAACAEKPQGAARGIEYHCQTCGAKWERVQLTLFPTRQGSVDLGATVDWIYRGQAPIIIGE